MFGPQYTSPQVIAGIGEFMKKYFGVLVLCLVSQFASADMDGNCLSALGLGMIPNGATASGYLTSLSLPGTPCALTTVTCQNGSFSGPLPYPSCVE
jgi:hypothetical protein